ncbi:MAG TPA: septum site-determining protein MinC [Syntrophomonadaceae bacterium]|nr:septum site-determining protein MinC [Syntrophomonadaceae bacterium]
MATLSILKKKSSLISLKTFNTFVDIKHELTKRLANIESQNLGTQVIIDLGDMDVTTKQIHEIEDILLDHGLYLKELRANTSFDEGTELSETNEFSEMSQYEQTALVCKNLRSGQRIFADGNVVILGDINPGAEVIARGNIMVMGTLRGMVHAGAFGDETSIIAAYRLIPTQLRIANHITRPPDGEAIVVKTPEIARIKAGKVIIEKLKI